jgi:hypothetical protein
MLAQNFKTAADLQISNDELSALIKVLGMLERVELIHGTNPLASSARKPNEFNMGATLTTRCGTIGCIAGWAYHISNGEAFPEIVKGDMGDWTVRNKKLRDLFGIGRSCGSLFSIQPEQAAAALRSYLTTGDSRWDLAVQS